MPKRGPRPTGARLPGARQNPVQGATLCSLVVRGACRQCSKGSSASARGKPGASTWQKTSSGHSTQGKWKRTKWQAAGSAGCWLLREPTSKRQKERRWGFGVGGELGLRDAYRFCCRVNIGIGVEMPHGPCCNAYLKQMRHAACAVCACNGDAQHISSPTVAELRRQPSCSGSNCALFEAHYFAAAACTAILLNRAGLHTSALCNAGPSKTTAVPAFEPLNCTVRRYSVLYTPLSVPPVRRLYPLSGALAAGLAMQPGFLRGVVSWSAQSLHLQRETAPFIKICPLAYAGKKECER